MKSRRNFIKTIGVAGAASLIPISTIANDMAKQKMIHQVYFWLHDKNNTKEFLTEAVPMLGKCKDVAKFIAGVPAATADLPGRGGAGNAYPNAGRAGGGGMVAIYELI